LEPRLVKKGLLVSTSPLTVKVWIAPVGVANGLRSSSLPSSLPSRAPFAPRISVLESDGDVGVLVAPPHAKISVDTTSKGIDALIVRAPFHRFGPLVGIWDLCI
jgi:hypothetical protein